MINTLKINDSLEVRIGLFIQIQVPNVFDQCNTEEEINGFATSYSHLLRNEYKVDDILLVRGVNSIKGENTISCLMGLSWIANQHKLYKLNILWFQQGYAFPINKDIQREIKNLRLHQYGTEEIFPY